MPKPIPLSTRLPADLHEWLRVTAEARCVSVQYLITKAVRELRESIPELPK